MRPRIQPTPRTVVAMLDVHDGAAIALRSVGGAVMTYGQLRAQVGQAGQTLNAYGLGRGDAVALVLDNGPHMAAAFASVAAWASAAPLHPGLRAHEFRETLDDLGARALVTDASRPSAATEAAESLGIPVIGLERVTEAGGFRLAVHGRRGDANSPGLASVHDTALLLHTSGTTARPKLVPLSQANLAASARNIARTLQLQPGDACLNVMPLFHIHGLVGVLLSSLRAGAEVIASPGFHPLRFFQWLEDSQPTWYSAVPTMHQAILQRAARNADRLAPNRLRFIRSSSAALPPTVLADLEATFECRAVESYGMTEASHQMTSNPLAPDERKPGTVGVEAGPEAAIMDASGALVPWGQRGEVVVRGENVMAGYADNPEANAKSFHGDWFRTGDEGFRDADGYFTITGRLKEIINRGGEKIAPREIDEALLHHPDVDQVVAFAVRHPKLGEEVAVAIVPREGAAPTEAGIREFASERLAAFKVPRRVVFLQEIPKGPSGKLKRVGLARELGMD